MSRGKCIVLLAVLCLRGARGASDGYADPASCAACHRQIAENYSKTGMARSFRTASVTARRPELEPANYGHEASRQHFTSFRRDDAYYIRRTAPDAGRALEVRVDYAIGSGERAVSYLHRTPDNQLTEVPITWYSQDGGHWGMSPAYDRAQHSGFSRPIPYRCMFCHNAYPDMPGPATWDGATLFPATLPQGIDCQRCHGPGASHVAAANAGRPTAEIRAAIVNPARLTQERRTEVCLQCHLETTSMPLPGATLRMGRGVFSYRPGEPLSDYQTYFDHAPGTGHDDKFELVSSAYRLRQSACYLANPDSITCTTCHDPHQATSREESVRITNRACGKCHGDAVAIRTRQGKHPAASDCASCHMPRRQGADAIHIAVTDHRIQRPSARTDSRVEQHDGNTLPYGGEVVAYYPKKADPLEVAIAQVKSLANLPAGLVQLEKLLTSSPAREAAPYFELAAALRETRQAARAVPFFEQAVKLAPTDWHYAYDLAQAMEAAGDTAHAVTVLQRAVSLAPQEPGMAHGLALAYLLAGRTLEGLRTLREALQRNPEDAGAQFNLGEALLQAGDVPGGEAALREAVRLRPESRTIRAALATELLQTGRFREATVQFEEVLRMGASTDTARSEWVATLAATGSVPEARRRYEDSLRRQVAETEDDLGTALLSQGDAPAALRHYRLALESDPQFAFAAMHLGLTLAEPIEARHWLEEALRLDDSQLPAHLKLGELLLAAGLRNEANAHLKMAATASDPAIRAAAAKLLELMK